jgi:hypothetical protein
MLFFASASTVAVYSPICSTSRDVTVANFTVGFSITVSAAVVSAFYSSPPEQAPNMAATNTAAN